MLCPHLHLQTSSSSLLPYLEPTRTLWPTSQAIFAWAERDFIQTMKEMTRTMELMDEFHRRLLREVTYPNKVRCGGLEDTLEGSSLVVKNGEHFTLSLAVPGFTTNEMTVKLVGRKLLMLGSKETKNDDGDGSFSYKYEVFRRESDLPEDVNLEGLTCSLSGDGQLRIEAPRHTLLTKTERNVPIQLTSAVTAESKVPGNGGDSTDQNKADVQEAANTDQSKTEGQSREAAA